MQNVRPQNTPFGRRVTFQEPEHVMPPQFNMPQQQQTGTSCPVPYTGMPAGEGIATRPEALAKTVPATLGG